MSQPETTYPVHASDFPPRARVKEIVQGLRAHGFVLRRAGALMGAVWAARYRAWRMRRLAARVQQLAADRTVYCRDRRIVDDERTRLLRLPAGARATGTHHA
jgi:hypothetical protein